MIVLRMLWAPGAVFASVGERSRWFPFFLASLIPVALGLLATTSASGRLPGAERLPVSSGLLMGAIALAAPFGWLGRCVGTASLLSLVGTLLSAKSRFRDLFVAAAGASVALTAQSLLQSLTSIGLVLAGRRPVPLDDSVLLLLGPSAPGGLPGALLGAFGLFRLWHGALLVIGLATITGRTRPQAALQVAPVWLGAWLMGALGSGLTQPGG